MAQNGRLCGRREQAALALACGQSVRGAARALHVGERTLTRWRADPDFMRRVRDLQNELLARAVGRLSCAMPEAAAKLRKLLASGSEKIQLAAAGKLLECGLKLRELADFEERLAALEEQGQPAQRSERFSRNGR